MSLYVAHMRTIYQTEHLLESRLKPTLYLILYGVPDILKNEEMQTKKIVELFGDFVAIESSFTGEVHYLPNYWSEYPAAKRALEMIEIEEQAHKHVANIKKSLKFIENRWTQEFGILSRIFVFQKIGIHESNTNDYLRE